MSDETRSASGDTGDAGRVAITSRGGQTKKRKVDRQRRKAIEGQKCPQVEWPSPHVGGQTKNVGRTDNVVKPTDDRNVLQMRHVQPQVMQVSRPHVGARPFKALSRRGLAVEQFVC
ncbi:hypothetical protein Bbelb_339390 [Branchiostoma belcheri]|nr:hypothetical protein Bbelb_339390 [Branchiostoma belcheri]